MAHYPTGASKWNPIEHRLFSEVSRNWAGEPLDSYQKILNYARTTKTQTGLTVTAYLDRRQYPCGLKPTPQQVASLRLQRHPSIVHHPNRPLRIVFQGASQFIDCALDGHVLDVPGVRLIAAKVSGWMSKPSLDANRPPPIIRM